MQHTIKEEKYDWITDKKQELREQEEREAGGELLDNYEEETECVN